MPMSQLVSAISRRSKRMSIDMFTGTTLSAIHFVPGQDVDVIADSFVTVHYSDVPFVLIRV